MIIPTSNAYANGEFRRHHWKLGMIVFSLCAGLTPSAGIARNDAYPCQQLQSHLDADRVVVVPGHLSGHVVIGKRRLYFHSAPSAACATAIFIIPGDVVNVLEEYEGFSNVTYVNPQTGRMVDGWVESHRLRSNGSGIAPRQ